MNITDKNLLGSGNDRREYITKDRRYTTAATPMTTGRFGPSGSLRNRNSTREHTIDVTLKMSNEVLFDLGYIAIVSGNLAGWEYYTQHIE